MIAAFRSGDLQKFDDLAQSYGVTHLLVRTQPDRTEMDAEPGGFCRVLQAGSLSIFVRCQNPV